MPTTNAERRQDMSSSPIQRSQQTSSARRINHPVDKENVVHDGYLKQPNNMDAKSSPQKIVNGPLAYRTQPSIQSSFQQQQQQPLDGFRMRRGASLQPNGALFPSMGQENVFQNSKSLHQMEQERCSDPVAAYLHRQFEEQQPLQEQWTNNWRDSHGTSKVPMRPKPIRPTAILP